MIAKKKQKGFLAKRIVYLLAWLASLALLLILRYENVPIYVAIFAVVTFLFWYSAYHLSSTGTPAMDMESTESFIETPRVSSLSADRYFSHLADNLNKNWLLCDSDLDHALATLRNVHHALLDAIDTAKSTGMLALNSMTSAANTGEVGRGFMTVSRDLISISEQSGKDLEQMRDIIAKAEQRMMRTRRIMSSPLVEHLALDNVQAISELVHSITNVQGAQESLRIIAERYQRNNKSDVRWMQLGDAVRRLLNEVINVLYQFELRLNDVISDLRLARLSGTLSKNQLLEIKGRMSSDMGSEGTI